MLIKAMLKMLKPTWKGCMKPLIVKDMGYFVQHNPDSCAAHHTSDDLLGKYIYF